MKNLTTLLFSILIVFLVVPSLTFAQPPHVIWSTTFGGDSQDGGFEGQETSDGGFIIIGGNQSFGNGEGDVWLIKTDSNGNEEWNHTYGGDEGEKGFSGHQTDDGGYIITGYTWSFGNGENDIWLIKTDSLGQEEWNKTFGETGNEAGESVQQTSDGGYILVGSTSSFQNYSDTWLIKTDSQGNEEWNQVFIGSNSYNHPHSVQETSNGGYIIIGTTNSFGEGDYDVWLIKADSQGNEEWSQTFGGSEDDYGKSVQQTSDGDYIVIGTTSSFGNYSDVLLLKLGFENWYIATTGSDETGDGSEENPFASIQFGIDNAETGDSIFVQSGTYVENINYNGKNIVVQGEDRETTIIDGNQTGSVVIFENGEDTTAVLDGFTIQNGQGMGDWSNFYGGGITCKNTSSPYISNVTISNNTAGYGGGISCQDNSSPTLILITISNNVATNDGGGIHCIYNSSPNLTFVTISNNNTSWDGGGIYYFSNTNSILTNVLINENIAGDNGGGIYCRSNTSLTLINVTISGNNDSEGGGIYCRDNSHLNLLNCILWNDLPHEVYFHEDYEPNSITISYSDIQGGEESIVTNNNGTVYWEEGNIDTDPLFCNADSSDYTLAENSPCVSTGENGANMGAYGVGCGPIYLVEIVINEIMQNPSSVVDSDGEWFELYNAGEDTVDVSGWVFKDADDDSLSLDVDCCLNIPPNGHFLMICNGDSAINGGISNYDFVYEREAFNLGNSDDEIIIIDSYGRGIDTVVYDGGSNWPDPDGKSMELIYHDLDNNDGSNWVESTHMLPSGDYGTPGEGNSTLLPALATNINANCHGGVNNGWMDLGAIEIDDSSQCMLFVENQGYGDLILSNIHIGESQNDNPNTAFSVTVDSLVIPPEGVDSIVVYFSPEEAGFYSGSLSFETNDDSSPTHNEAVHGTGLSPVREIYIDTDFDSDTLYYHNAQLGDSTYFEYLYIYNLGNTQLEIDDIITTEPFYVDINDGSLGPLELLEVPVQFFPDSAGEYSGTVTIYSNDSDESELIVHLVGTTESLNVDVISIPTQFSLHQNHPNPFNPITTLRYDLPEQANVNIIIYDMLGRQVRTVVNQTQDAGFKSVIWDATNDFGKQVSAGVYIYQIQAGEFVQTRKMVLLK